LITPPTTAYNIDRRRRDESYCALFEVVGLLLWHRLTKRYQISDVMPASGRWSQFLRAKSGGCRQNLLWKIQQTLAPKKDIDQG
jgi:hypothetical protein